MKTNSRQHSQTHVVDVSLLERPEAKEQLLMLLHVLADVQTDLPPSLPDDPILQLVAVAQVGIEHMRLNRSSLTSRSSEYSARSHRLPDPDRELKKLTRVLKQQRRALSNYEFFLRQPEVTETINKALGRLNTLKCAYCHKFFTAQYYLDQHVVRRHPELAGLGAERMKTDRREMIAKTRQMEALNGSFFPVFESIQKAVLMVNSQKAQKIQSLMAEKDGKNKENVKEIVNLQAELTRLIDQQMRLLSEQMTQYREMQLIEGSSPPISRSESQQTSFFDRISLGETALESLQFKPKSDLENTGKIMDFLPESKGNTIKKVTDLEKIEVSFKEAKLNLAKIREKVGILMENERKFVVFEGKYGLEMKSVYFHTEEEIKKCRKDINREIYAKINENPPKIEKNRHFFTVKNQLSQEIDRFCGNFSTSEDEIIDPNAGFQEGKIVKSTFCVFSGLKDGQKVGKHEKMRESLLSLDCDNSVSFSIRWGDEDEESGEWRGISASEARRLGFFFQ